MTRKDLIIISSLVNAGILALLFMLATGNDDTVAESQHGMAPIAEAIAETSNPSPQKEEHAFAAKEEDFDAISSNFLADEMEATFGQDEEGYIPLEKKPEKVVQQAQESQSDASSEYLEIKVKKGDALEKIARNNGTTVEAIKQANNLSSVKLSIGQTLRIPITKGTTAKQGSSQPVAAAPAQNAEPLYHTVKVGDSPWKIAKQYQVSMEDILKLNDLNESQARNLKIGEKIRVR